MGRKRTLDKAAEDSEDYCFKCYDGGYLILCDRKNCHKAYHLDCVKKDASFADSEKRWSCGWHYCCKCKRSSNFRCFCCQNAICGRCITKYQDFRCLRGSYGFCGDCLKMATMVEEGRTVDSDGEEVDFNDRDSFEGLFKEYWEIIKNKEGLTLDDLEYAQAHITRGKKRKSHSHKSQPDSEEYKNESKQETSESDSDSSSDKGAPEQKITSNILPSKRSRKQKRIFSNKREFFGWGSKPLIEFLASIGKDTSQKLSQGDVSSIIIQYAQENKLFDPVRKKVIHCDARLRSVLGRKSSSIYKINDFLESHFLENIEQSDDNDQGTSSDDGDENVYDPVKKPQKCGSSINVQKKQSPLDDFQKNCDTANEENAPSRVSVSCFASIIPKNLKLVYLKRSLVEELLKQPETFEDKVIGSFVKVKSNVIDYKHAYQLFPVTGIKKISADGTKIGCCLTVACMAADITISMLSNDEISEDECAVLREKMEDGLLEKPTVVDLQLKAKTLHEDITKHWITRELALLHHRIDQANEKGWRDLQRKKLLESPEEQLRLLQEVPQVIADMVDAKTDNSVESVQNQSPETIGEKKKKPLRLEVSKESGASQEFLEAPQVA